MMVEVDSNDIRNDLVRINHAKEMSMLKMNAQSPVFSGFSVCGHSMKK
jgi:hypothetical protein